MGPSACVHFELGGNTNVMALSVHGKQSSHLFNSLALFVSVHIMAREGNSPWRGVSKQHMRTDIIHCLLSHKLTTEVGFEAVLLGVPTTHAHAHKVEPQHEGRGIVLIQ